MQIGAGVHVPNHNKTTISHTGNIVSNQKVRIVSDGLNNVFASVMVEIFVYRSGSTVICMKPMALVPYTIQSLGYTN